MPELIEWSIWKGPYEAPELGFKFRGVVFDHPRFPDHASITTSRVVDFDTETEEFITTSGTRYKLGEPLEEFEEAFPGARQGLIDTASKWTDEDRYGSCCEGDCCEHGCDKCVGA